MFLDFFDTLKRKGIDVSMTEWLTLMDALDKGLIESSFTKFYYVSRMILVKSESDYDKFDMAFSEYFKDVKSEDAALKRVLEWLDKGDQMEFDKQNQQMYSFSQTRNSDEVKRLFRERLAEQNSEQTSIFTCLVNRSVNI